MIDVHHLIVYGYKYKALTMLALLVKIINPYFFTNI